MKSLLSLSLAWLIGFSLAAQDIALAPDQNPNYRKSMAKYDSLADDYIAQQGTTVQDTYEAIDPLEHRREMRELRREYRAKRPLWRHQRRLARAQNPGFFGNGWNNWGWGGNVGWNRNRGWNNGWGLNNQWGWNRGNNVSIWGGNRGWGGGLDVCNPNRNRWFW